MLNFVLKFEVALQEADESHLWIELLRDDRRIRTEAIEQLYLETNELIAIFVTMLDKTKRNDG